jgi:hypothetical protein
VHCIFWKEENFLQIVNEKNKKKYFGTVGEDFFVLKRQKGFLEEKEEEKKNSCNESETFTTHFLPLFSLVA